MRQLTLPGGKRRTTQLAFGCAYLTAENKGILDAAYDAGIRHFDVARSYGSGLTEGIVGGFIRRRRADVSLTSKYGIRPPFSHPLHAAARAVLKPIVRKFRSAPIAGTRLATTAGLTNRKANFTGAEATASLKISLRNLRADYLDLFLMHEAEASDLADAGLLDALEAAVQSGLIGAYGVGGESRRIDDLLIQRPRFCRVLQSEWTALQPARRLDGAFCGVFRVYGDPARRVRDLFQSEPHLARLWSDEVGHDLKTPGIIEGLFLRAATDTWPEAMVLFSSSRVEHVLANVRAVIEPGFADGALELVRLLRNKSPYQSSKPT